MSSAAGRRFGRGPRPISSSAGMPTTCRWWQLAAASEGAASYCGNTGDPRSLQGGRSSHVCAHSIRVQHRLQRPGEAGEVAVVDAAVIELIGEFAQQPRPVSPSRFQGDADVHPSLDDLDRAPARGGRPGLFPRAVAAGGRTPLGDRSSASGNDRPAAPSTGGRGGPSMVSADFMAGLLRESFGGSVWCTLGALTPFSFTFTLPCPVLGAAAAFHAPRLHISLQQPVTTSGGTRGAEGVSSFDLVSSPVLNVRRGCRPMPDSGSRWIGFLGQPHSGTCAARQAFRPDVAESHSAVDTPRSVRRWTDAVILIEVRSTASGTTTG
jgi:hypothetical protein